MINNLDSKDLSLKFFFSSENTLRKKYLIVENGHKKQYIQEYVVNKLGLNIFNCEIVSLEELSNNVIFAYNSKLINLQKSPVEAISDRIMLTFISNLLSENNFTYYKEEINSIKLAKEILKMISECRLSDVKNNLNLDNTHKKEFFMIYDAYINKLKNDNLIDYCDKLEITTSNLDYFDFENPLFGYFDDQNFYLKEERLIKAIEDKFETNKFVVYNHSEPKAGDNVKFLKARGMRNEVVQVFKTIKELNLSPNTVEICYTGSDYLPIIENLGSIYGMEIASFESKVAQETRVYEILTALNDYLLSNYKIVNLKVISDTNLFYEFMHNKEAKLGNFSKTFSEKIYFRPSDIKTYIYKLLEIKKINIVQFEFFTDFANLFIISDDNNIDEKNYTIIDKVNQREFLEKIQKFIFKYSNKKNKLENEVLKTISDYSTLTTTDRKPIYTIFNELFNYLDELNFDFVAVPEQNNILTRQLVYKRPIIRDNAFVIGMNNHNFTPTINDNPVLYDHLIQESFKGAISLKEKNQNNVKTATNNIYQFIHDSYNNKLFLSYNYFDLAAATELNPVDFFEKLRKDKVIEKIDYDFNKDNNSIPIDKNLILNVEKKFKLEDYFQTIVNKDVTEYQSLENNDYLITSNLATKASASTLIKLLQNPMNLFFEKVLKMRDFEEETRINDGDWLSGMQRGNLIHAILEDCFKVDGKYKIDLKEDYEKEFNNILRRNFDSYRVDFPPLFDEDAIREEALITSVLVDYLAKLKDEEITIIDTETDFGRTTRSGISEEPDSIEIHIDRVNVVNNGDKLYFKTVEKSDDNSIVNDKLSLQLAGSIDRVDINEEKKKIIITDYKTGRLKYFHDFMAIQGYIYGLAIMNNPEHFSLNRSQVENYDIEYHFVFLNPLYPEENTTKIYYFKEDEKLDLAQSKLACRGLVEIPKKEEKENIAVYCMLLKFVIGVVNNNGFNDVIIEHLIEFFDGQIGNSAKSANWLSAKVWSQRWERSNYKHLRKTMGDN